MSHVALTQALLCANCSTIYDMVEHPDCCPMCASKFYVKLEGILNPKKVSV